MYLQIDENAQGKKCTEYERNFRVHHSTILNPVFPYDVSRFNYDV